MRLLLSPRLSAMVLSSLLASPLFAQEVGPEFRVNGQTVGSQIAPAVASDRYGSFVVVWMSDGQDGDGEGVFGRVYDSTGASVTSFRVNSYTTGNQTFPSVAADPFGVNFVVVWLSYNQIAPGTTDIFGQKFGFNGTPLEGEFRVNTVTGGYQGFPAIAARATGDFVVVWYDYVTSEVLGRRFDFGTGPLGSEFALQSATLPHTGVEVCYEPSGDFVATWTSFPSVSNEVFARRFDSSGNPLAPRFQVNTYTTGKKEGARVACNATAAGFVVVWSSDLQDGDGLGVIGRAYDSLGSPAGPEFQVNGQSTNDQMSPGAAWDSGSTFVVTWDSVNQDGSGHGIFRRRFDSSGSPVAGGFGVNTTTAGNQIEPVVAGAPNGKFVIAWASAGQDGDSYGVFGQRYCVGLATVDVVVYGNVPVCPGGTGGFALVTDMGGGTVTHAWGYRTVTGGGISYIPGETFLGYNVQGADFPPTPGDYLLVCVSTPECGQPRVSNEVTITITTNDTTTAPHLIAPNPATVTQTLCQ